MSNYDRLTGLISAGELELVHVEAVPRSISTALARALSESCAPSIYVNEPFNRMQHDIEDASKRILSAVDETGRPNDVPLTIVSKNMARNISRPIFSEMVELSRGIVWSIRDPQVQISSLLTRIANDLRFEPGADKLAMEDLTDTDIWLASDFLESGPKSTNFSKTSWQDIGEHYDMLDDATTSIVVDGTELTKNPGAALQAAARILGLTFSGNMVDGWQGKFVNANTGYNANLTDETHAWTKDAVISVGIHASSEQVIPIDRMPYSLQDHLFDVAFPIYNTMMADKLSVVSDKIVV